MSLSHHILFISWANLRHFPNLFPPSLSDGAKISNSSTMRWRVQYLRHLKGLSKRKTYFMDIENRLHRLFHCRLLHLWDGNNITFLLMFDFVYQRDKSCGSSVCILRWCQNSMRKEKDISPRENLNIYFVGFMHSYEMPNQLVSNFIFIENVLKIVFKS